METVLRKGYSVIDARFVPLEQWPGKKTKNRQSSRFKIQYGRLLDELEEELKKLRARDIMIQAEISREEIRNDGWPKSNARFRGPGIILTFTTPKGDISFPCDTYLDWESNLRAISLTLTALRSIDRYGVSKHAEQYKGWAKLPPAPKEMTVKDAMAFMDLHSGILPGCGDSARKAYRLAAAKLHPDNPVTGNPDQFHLLSKAKETLERVHGW